MNWSVIARGVDLYDKLFCACMNLWQDCLGIIGDSCFRWKIHEAEAGRGALRLLTLHSYREISHLAFSRWPWIMAHPAVMLANILNPGSQSLSGFLQKLVCLCERVCERGRQTDGQTDRGPICQTGRQTYWNRQAEKDREAEKVRETETQIE